MTQLTDEQYCELAANLIETHDPETLFKWLGASMQGRILFLEDQLKNVEAWYEEEHAENERLRAILAKEGIDC